MSSIPLPALNVRPPQQQESPLQQYAQLQQLLNAKAEAPLRQQALQQQVQAGQQGLQAGQLDLQQKQRQVKDQDAATAAYHEWDGKNYDQLPELILKNGGSANVVNSVRKSLIEQREATAKLAAEDATTGSKNIETKIKKNDMVAGAIGNVMNMPDEQLAPGLVSTAQDLAQQGLIDPEHAQAAAQIAQTGNPEQIRKQLSILQKSYMGQVAQMDYALKQAQQKKTEAEARLEQGKADPKSPFYAPSKESVAMGTAPGAKEIKAGEVKQAGAKAAAEAAARQPFELRLAAQKQSLSQGDPKAAAQLMVDGDATLSELKARGATPDFISRTLFEARKLSGGKYNAQEAEANFKVAQSPTNVAFFGSAKSLTDKGGTLDQLAEIAKDIPASDISAWNSLEDWTKAATGNGPLAKYAATALGVADDYSKVMGSGQGSDSSRHQALDLVKAAAGPKARAGSLAGIRGAVTSQMESRIGKNPVLKRMYGYAGGSQSVQEGATKTNSHGDKIVFKGGQWQIQ